MNDLHQLENTEIVVFLLDETRYGLYLTAVQRVVRSVEISPLPKAPAFVLGVINVSGDILPVFDLRQRMHLKQHKQNVNDQFILSTLANRQVALMVDAVTGVYQVAEEDMVSAEQILPGIEFVQGLVKMKDGLLLICDLQQFLTSEEEQQLQEALTQAGLPSTEGKNTSKIQPVE